MRSILALFAGLALLARASIGRADDATYVIPPGQEALILQLLGGPDPLPEGCALAGARVAGNHIDATYGCGGRQITIVLAHPDGAPAGAERTTAFALTGPADAPEGLVAGVGARVRRQESRFAWKGIPPPNADPPVTQAPSAARPFRAAVLTAMLAVPLAAVALRARLARRRK